VRQPMHGCLEQVALAAKPYCHGLDGAPEHRRRARAAGARRGLTPHRAGLCAPAGRAAPVVVQADLAHRDDLAVAAAVLQQRAQLREQALRPARVRAKVTAVRRVHAHRAEQPACARHLLDVSDLAVAGLGEEPTVAGDLNTQEGGRCAPTELQNCIERW